MRKSIIAIFCLLAGWLYAFALDLPAHPIEQNGPYARYELADSCYIEVMQYEDSIVVIKTMCAPICSSYAHVYNKEWQSLHELKPACRGFLPYAYFRDGMVVWEDNTRYLLDDEEKKRLEE